MRIVQSICAIVDKTKNLLRSEGMLTLGRMKATSFTRERAMPFQDVMLMILHMIRRPLQMEIDQYFKEIGKPMSEVSKQAFSKQRQNLNPEAVRLFFDMTAESIVTESSGLYTYNGMHLLAIDCSDLAVENTVALKEAFGVSSGNAATAKASLVYDTLNDIMIDARIGRFSKDERDFLPEHISRLMELKLDKSLLIMDRGYPSRELIADFLDYNTNFLMRVRRKFSNEIDASGNDSRFSFARNDSNYSVRVIKVLLDSGETETLLTNLSEDILPSSKAKELYFERWKIEVKLNSLKNKLELENFSGQTEISVKQDFYATMYFANLAAALQAETDAAIQIADSGKGLKYERKTNENRLLSNFRDYFITILLENDLYKRELMFDSLAQLICKRPVEIKPDRHPGRKAPRKRKFCRNYPGIL